MIRILLIGLVCLCVNACTSIDELKSTKTYTPKVIRSGAVNVAARATGITSSHVGNTTLLLTVPLGTIKTRGDTSANIMKSVGQALNAAGYNAENSDYTSADAGYLRAHVEDIEFGNFLFSSWGTVIIHLRLETRDGALLWKTRLRTSINAINNYDRTAIITMNRLVKEMTKTFAKNDFYQATLRVKRHNDFIKEDIAISK